MISNMPTDEDLLFTHPENLQHLRHQLQTLMLQDKQSAQILNQDFKMFINQRQQQIRQNDCERPTLQIKQLEFLKQVDTALQEKSYLINALAQLASKMIDFILLQHQTSFQLQQEYYTKIQTLKQQNDCLTSKNVYIQKDIEYFREHLQATQDQLENIIVSQNSINYKPDEQEKTIRYLQQQIQRIRQQLQFYKFNASSRKSNLKIHQPQEPNHCLITQNRKYENPHNENKDIRIRLYSQGTNVSVKSIKIYQQSIREEQNEQTERIPATISYQPQFIQIKQEQQLKKQENLKQKILQTPIFKQMPNNLHQQRSLNYQVEELNSQNRILSQQWSIKSFNIGGNSLTKLANLGQHQFLYQGQKDVETLMQLTKQTDDSMKSIHKESEQDLKQIGINTQFITIKEYYSNSLMQYYQSYQQLLQSIIIKQIKKMSKNIEQLYLLKGIATQHMKQARYSEAIVYFKDVLTKFKQEVTQITSQKQMEKVIRQLQLASQKNLSLCYLKLQNYQNCVNQCQTVLDVEPNNLKIIYRIGRAYIQLKNHEMAEKYLKKGFYLDPQEKQIMKALQEIQLAKNTATNQKPQSKSSFNEVLQWIILLVLAMIKYPFRAKQEKENKHIL